MRKLLLLFAVCALFALCTGTVLGQRCTADDYSIVATFAGVNGQPPYSITSDGMGSYSTIKGRGINTEVMFQVCNGSKDFTMNLNTSSRTMKVLLPGGTANSTFFNFDRVASIPVTENSDRFADFCGGRDAFQSILLNTPNTSTADNYAGCGFDAGGYYVRRNVGFQLTSGRSLRFQNSPYDGGTLAAGTSYIKVYHPTVSGWTLAVEDIAPAGNPGCGNNGSCGAIIYQPNNGGAYVEQYVIGRFQISVSSSKIYP
ncbi:MAG: hypothetical protein ABIU09_09580 [Pyrinomonadaceae bacterium]